MTRAVLIATRQWHEESALIENGHPSLLTLMDRPFLQHLLEYLVNQGVTEFDVILCQFPEKIQSLLGDGTRWNVRIRYHLIKDPARPYRPIRFLDNDADSVLLIHTDRLPLVDPQMTRPSTALSGPILYCLSKNAQHQEGYTSNWSGWAWIPEKQRGALPDNITKDELFTYLMSGPGPQGTVVEISKALCVSSYTELFYAHMDILKKHFNGLMLNGREVEEGIWLSRNVSLHPTAKIITPVYIGENCNIGKKVQLGPNVVISKGSVIDARSIIADSVILPGSYVGEVLELRDVLVDKNLLVNIRIGSEITIDEDFILGSLSDYNDVRHWWRNIFSRSAAITFLLMTLPMLLIIGLYNKIKSGGPLFFKKEMVRLPAPADKTRWRTSSLFGFYGTDVTMPSMVGWRDLFHRFFPGMINIVLGNIHFVGVKPKTKEEIEALPTDWRSLYLKSKTGIVTEALVNFGVTPTQDELYSAEAIYSVSSSFKYDLRLLATYSGQILGLLPKPDKEIEEVDDKQGEYLPEA